MANTHCSAHPCCRLCWTGSRACAASTAMWTIRSARCHRTPGASGPSARTGTDLPLSAIAKFRCFFAVLNIPLANLHVTGFPVAASGGVPAPAAGCTV